MFKNLLKRFDQANIEHRKVIKVANEVELLKDSMEVMSDDELRLKTEEFKKRLENGENLDDIIVEAFAVVREAAKRVTGMFAYNVQLQGAAAIHYGNIAEMKTGEGKTLTSVFPAYLNALSGKGVHIVTVNEYLAAREADGEIGEIFKWLGMSVALNTRDLTKKEKKEAYLCDVLYSTNNELGFDYLRDNMVLYAEEKVQRPLNFAIIDEVDSILVDEARTPLIISGGKKKTANLYMMTDRFVKGLKNEDDFFFDEKTKAVNLTDQGVDRAEKTFKIDNLYDIKHSALVHHIQQALKANYSMSIDVDYVVQEGEIVIVDQFTGRLMKGRAFSEGLHQAIEAKEGVSIKDETRTLATITFQNYFRMYNKLSGMTGTAKTEEEEFRDIYNMFVIEIDTNRPIVRDDQADLIYATKNGKYNAIVKEIKERHEAGQPILVGTIAIETSELISQLLTRSRVPHEVLNAKNHAREAEIIAKAGAKGSVTIATNMAGRGTDIKLGEGVKEVGGLCVIGTERHESRRIDNQLRGRSGRQGDPGYSQFFISLQDELMVRFGNDNIQGVMQRLGFEEDEAIQSKLISRSIESAQKRVEGSNYDVRKRLLQYDDVLRQQREIIYERRDVILTQDSIHDLVLSIIDNTIENFVNSHLNEELALTKEDIQKIVEYMNTNMFKPDTLKFNDFENLDQLELKEKLSSFTKVFYENKKVELNEETFNEFEKVVSLRVFDQYWMNHIDTMAHLREGISLRSYAQEDPLRSYTMEGFQLFDDMLASIDRDITRYLLKAEIRQNLEREEVEKGQANDGKAAEGSVRKPRRKEKVGRNDLCPCGSGKKFKNCHGR
jgi:preprotein translocase subunit SecA